jgi:outer membrane protein OmpA-like peptidoglycan-associated protein
VRRCLLLVAFLSITFSLYSQSDTNSDLLRFRAGIFGDLGINYHSTNFRNLPGIPNCCLNFRGGTGFGIFLGGLVEIPFSEKFLFSLRGGYSTLNGNLIEHDYTKVLVDDVLTDGEFEHTIKASISALKMDVLIGSEIYPHLLLYAGLEGGLLMQKDFHQQEILTQPPDRGVFSDTKQRIRNDTAGVIPQINNFNTYIKCGLSYELPLNSTGTLIAAPEVFYTYALTDIVDGLPWKINTLNFGIAIKYSPLSVLKFDDEIKKQIINDTLKILTKVSRKNNFIPGEPVFIEKKQTRKGNLISFTEIFQKTDTLFVNENSALTATIVTGAVYKDGTKKDVMDINIRQQFVTQAFTVLPFVFFEINSSTLPPRYIIPDNPNNFAIEKLEANPLVYHHNTLNIIGKRLGQIPNSTLTIEGFADPASENGDCNLANARADAVSEYLTAVWKISSDRISVIKPNKSCSPHIITQSQNEQGFADNRHVMLSSDDAELFAPIIKTRYLETIDLPVKTFEHKVGTNPKGNISSWVLTETQKDTTPVFRTYGEQLPDVISQDIDEKFANSVETTIPLDININLQNYEGAKAVANYKIKVNKDTSEFEIERLSLAIFKVARFTLRELDKKAIQNFIKDLRPGDTISVIGFTDSLGYENENKTLSESRAATVCEYIRQLPEYLNHKATIIPCVGVWHTQKPPQIETYDSPEERFLSRIVQIEIRRRWR